MRNGALNDDTISNKYLGDAVLLGQYDSVSGGEYACRLFSLQLIRLCRIAEKYQLKVFEYL